LEYNVVCLKKALYGLFEPFEGCKSIHLRMNFFYTQENHGANKKEGMKGFARFEKKSLLRRHGCS